MGRMFTFLFALILLGLTYFPSLSPSQPLFPNPIYGYAFDQQDCRYQVQDYNHDGYPDLVILHSFSLISYVRKLVVVINDGQGWIREIRQLGIYNSPAEIAQAKTHGQPIPAQEPETLLVQKAQGIQKLVRISPLSWGHEESGQYQMEKQYPLSFPFAVMVDWDKDGMDDLVGGKGYSYVSELMIMKGLPQGGLEVGDPPAPGVRLEDVHHWPKVGIRAEGDINEDGHPDLVTVRSTGNHFNYGPVYLSFSLSQPDGQLVLDREENWGRTEGWWDYVLLYDFNEDNHLDLLFTHLGGFTLHWGNGKGEFRLTPDRSVRVGGGVVRLGDFNGDGIVDAVDCAQQTDYPVFPIITVALGEGDGHFGPGQPHWPVGEKIQYGDLGGIAIRVGDADGDKIDDLLLGPEPGVLWISRAAPRSHAAIGEFLR